MATASQSSYDDRHHRRLSTFFLEMPVKRPWSAWKRAGDAVHEKTDEDQDEGMWDNNDTAFVQDVALERHHQLHATFPRYIDNSVEEMRSPSETQSELAAAASSSSIASHPSSSLTLPINHNTRIKRASSVFGRLSGSGSDTSSTFSPPSSGSSRMDPQSRHRPGSLLFSGSNEVSPTSASFSSSSKPSPTLDYTHEGWTQEPIDYQIVPQQPVRLSSLPKERSLRRPSTSSAVFVSPSSSSKVWTREANHRPADNIPERSTESIESKVFYSTNKTPPSRRSSIVSGLKKLGGSLRSNNTPKATNRLSPVAASSDPPSRSASSTTNDEVQIVSASAISSMRLAPSPPAMSSHISFADRSRSSQPSTVIDESRTMSESGHKRRPSQAKEHEMNLGSRLFDKSGLPRNSSQRSNIQHISYDEARRLTGTFKLMDWSMQKSIAPHESHDEEREELQGDYSPMSGSPRQKIVALPSRPARYPDSSSIAPTSCSMAIKSSVEHDFNAAHDKRWSGSERRGSDVSKRRGSDASRHNTPNVYRVNSMNADGRLSWHKVSALEGLGLSQGNTTQSLSSSRRTSLGRQSSQKASQSNLFSNSLSRKQSANSLQISRPTSLISATSDIASISCSLPQGLHSTFEPTAALHDNDSCTSDRFTPIRPSRSATVTVEAKRPTFGLDLQPDAAAAFDSIPCPQSLKIRTSSMPALAGLSAIAGEEDVSMLGADGNPMPNEEFPRTPDREDEDSRDEQENKFDLANITVHSFNEVDDPRRLPYDTPQSPALEELELLEDLCSPTSRNSAAKAISFGTPLDFTDTPRSINADDNTASTIGATMTLSHSKSQEYFHGKPMTPQLIPRYDSPASRPRSTSYTYL